MIYLLLDGHSVIILSSVVLIPVVRVHLRAGTSFSLAASPTHKLPKLQFGLALFLGRFYGLPDLLRAYKEQRKCASTWQFGLHLVVELSKKNKHKIKIKPWFPIKSLLQITNLGGVIAFSLPIFR